MTDKESLRQKALADAEAQAKKQRFALFSQPPGIAIGDDGQYKTRLHPKNETGKPVTLQRNFQTSPPRSGQLNKSFFGGLNSLATHTAKDQYIQPGRRDLIEAKERFEKGKRLDIPNYKPASGPKTLASSSYEYVEDKPRDIDPKKNRQSDGKVKTKPRNFYTNPGSKVIHSFFKPIPHMDDPYERAKKMEVERMKKEKSLQGEQPFKPNSFTTINKVLNSDQKVYGEDVELKPKSPKQVKYNIFPHEKGWRNNNPNKHGLYGYLQPFPKYMENPPREVTRKSSAPKDRDIFKSMNSSLTAPSPSISQHPINLKRTFNHSFSHRF